MNRILLFLMVVTFSLGGIQTTQAQRLKKFGKKVEKTIKGNSKSSQSRKPSTSASNSPSTSKKTTSTSKEENKTTSNTTTVDDGCPKSGTASSYVRNIEKNLEKVAQGISEGCYSVGNMEDYISGRTGAEYFLASLKEASPECGSVYEKKIAETKKAFEEYKIAEEEAKFAEFAEIAPASSGTYNTSSIVYPKIEVQFTDHGMDINLIKEGQDKPEVISVPLSSNGVKQEKYEGETLFNSELKFTIYKKEDYHVIETIKHGEFGAITLFGNQELSILQKKVQEFEIPGSVSDGLYLGEVQNKEAGRIVLSISDNLGHDNKGPFNLTTLSLGSDAYLRAFYNHVEPPVETLQRAGIHTTRGGYGLRITTEYFLDGEMVANFEQGPLYDEDKHLANKWASSRHLLWKGEKSSHGTAFLENYVLKENLPAKDYELEIKKYVFNANDNQEDYKILLASSGLLTFRVTEGGYKKLCNTEYGPTKSPKNTSGKATTLLSTLRKHAKTQGWTETFINDVREVTQWTKVYNAFNKYLYSKCSATFRTVYAKDNGGKSYGEIKALFYKYPNGTLEVFGMAGQKYIPRSCN